MLSRKTAGRPASHKRNTRNCARKNSLHCVCGRPLDGLDHPLPPPLARTPSNGSYPYTTNNGLPSSFGPLKSTDEHSNIAMRTSHDCYPPPGIQQLHTSCTHHYLHGRCARQPGCGHFELRLREVLITTLLKRHDTPLALANTRCEHFSSPRRLSAPHPPRPPPLTSQLPTNLHSPGYGRPPVCRHINGRITGGSLIPAVSVTLSYEWLVMRNYVRS
jgi:hypothetical protein